MQTQIIQRIGPYTHTHTNSGSPEYMNIPQPSTKVVSWEIRHEFYDESFFTMHRLINVHDSAEKERQWRWKKERKEKKIRPEPNDANGGRALQRETCVDVYYICCINHRPQTSNYDMRAQYKTDSKIFFSILSAVPTQVPTKNVCTVHRINKVQLLRPSRCY